MSGASSETTRASPETTSPPPSRGSPRIASGRWKPSHAAAAVTVTGRLTFQSPHRHTYKTSLRLIGRLGVGFEDHRCAPCFDTFSSCQRHTLILQSNYLTPLLIHNYTIMTPIQLIVQLSNLTSNCLIYAFTHLCPHSFFARTHARTLALPLKPSPIHDIYSAGRAWTKRCVVSLKH